MTPSCEYFSQFKEIGSCTYKNVNHLCHKNIYVISLLKLLQPLQYYCELNNTKGTLRCQHDTKYVAILKVTGDFNACSVVSRLYIRFALMCLISVKFSRDEEHGNIEESLLKPVLVATSAT